MKKRLITLCLLGAAFALQASMPALAQETGTASPGIPPALETQAYEHRLTEELLQQLQQDGGVDEIAQDTYGQTQPQRAAFASEQIRRILKHPHVIGHLRRAWNAVRMAAAGANHVQQVVLQQTTRLQLQGLTRLSDAQVERLGEFFAGFLNAIPERQCAKLSDMLGEGRALHNTLSYLAHAPNETFEDVARIYTDGAVATLDGKPDLTPSAGALSAAAAQYEVRLQERLSFLTQKERERLTSALDGAGRRADCRLAYEQLLAILDLDRAPRVAMLRRWIAQTLAG